MSNDYHLMALAIKEEGYIEGLLQAGCWYGLVSKW